MGIPRACYLPVPSHPRRYKNLLARPTILRELTAERETLLAQLTALLDSMDGEYVWLCSRVCLCACLCARVCSCVPVCACVCVCVNARMCACVYAAGGGVGGRLARSLGRYLCDLPAVSPFVGFVDPRP